jgi:hypothetical protein
VSEDCHNSDNLYSPETRKSLHDAMRYWGWETQPEQIAQPLSPEFTQDDIEFLRLIKICVEEKS